MAKCPPSALIKAKDAWPETPFGLLPTAKSFYVKHSQVYFIPLSLYTSLHQRFYVGIKSFQRPLRFVSQLPTELACRSWTLEGWKRCNWGSQIPTGPGFCDPNISWDQMGNIMHHAKKTDLQQVLKHDINIDHHWSSFKKTTWPSSSGYRWLMMMIHLQSPKFHPKFSIAANCQDAVPEAPPSQWPIRCANYFPSRTNKYNAHGLGGKNMTCLKEKKTYTQHFQYTMQW